MRRVFAIALLTAAGAIIPAATPASAVCIESYYAVTGDCSPCHTLQRVWPSLICVQ